MVTHCTTKDFYKAFVNIKSKRGITSASVKHWLVEHCISCDNLPNYRLIPYKCNRETKIQSLQYKILNQVYPCRSKLFKWKIKETCLFCGDHDDLMHHFYACSEKTFWFSFNNWFDTICISCTY